MNDQKEYEGLELHEICRKVMENRRKILDDFAQAYLAENLKGTEIKNLTLNEQSVESPGFGYKYWFSEELNVEWKDFDDQEFRGREWIWVTNFERIWLSHPDHAIINTERRMWAKANIIHPEVPKKPPHCCEKDYLRCEEVKDGVLEIYSIKTIFEQHPYGSMTKAKNVLVKFCPFCGFKPNDP